jgi:hypothetical protein
MQHIFNSTTRIDFIKNDIDMYASIFIQDERAEPIPLLLEKIDIENAINKFNQINLTGLSYNLAKMTVTGALYLATKYKPF